MIDYAKRNTPLPEAITAEEVGATAAFLCSPLASGITGTTVYVDKGYARDGHRGRSLGRRRVTLRGRRITAERQRAQRARRSRACSRGLAAENAKTREEFVAGPRTRLGPPAKRRRPSATGLEEAEGGLDRTTLGPVTPLPRFHTARIAPCERSSMLRPKCS